MFEILMTLDHKLTNSLSVVEASVLHGGSFVYKRHIRRKHGRRSLRAGRCVREFYRYLPETFSSEQRSLVTVITIELTAHVASKRFRRKRRNILHAGDSYHFHLTYRHEYR
jgi:tRNA(Glu) U13 pseudouridine synthase TruD